MKEFKKFNKIKMLEFLNFNKIKKINYYQNIHLPNLYHNQICQYILEDFNQKNRKSIFKYKMREQINIIANQMYLINSDKKN